MHIGRLLFGAFAATSESVLFRLAVNINNHAAFAAFSLSRAEYCNMTTAAGWTGRDLSLTWKLPFSGFPGLVLFINSHSS